MKASTPAERLNIAFKFGNGGMTSKSGRIKARYSISWRSLASGKMRISRLGNCSGNASRHICALPICLSRLTISIAISPPGIRSAVVTETLTPLVRYSSPRPRAGPGSARARQGHADHDVSERAEKRGGDGEDDPLHNLVPRFSRRLPLGAVFPSGI